MSGVALGPLLESRRVILCVGCGGVGKTTTAAALGLAAAKRGKRVLCLTIDPARRLAQSLGIDEMTEEQRFIDEGLLAAVGVPAGGALAVGRLDTKSTFDSLIGSLAPTEAQRDRILHNALYRYISTALAGTQEYMAMERLYAVKGDPAYDLIILDTPPTANALDFMDAPERLVGAIDSDAVRWFVQAFQSDKKLSFNLLAKSTAFILRGMSKVTGSGFLEQVAEFLVEINSVFGGWKQRADAVSAALRAPDVGYVLVTSPDPLSVREVNFFGDRLREQRMHRDALVINRVNPIAGETPDPDRIQEALAAEELSAGPEFVERLQHAHRDEARQAKLDGIHLLALDVDETNGKAPIVVKVPTFARDVYELKALSQVASILAP